MSKETSLIKKYELQISKLENALKEAENVIRIQEKCIRTSEELLEQKEEYISMLTLQLEETIELSRTMAQVLDSRPNSSKEITDEADRRI